MSSLGAARQSFWFQFVTTPTADTPGTTLILHFNSQRYVFGRVGEGTQRAFIERGIGLRKVQNVFLTGNTGGRHQPHGGLLGMLLTTADVHAAAQLSSEAPLERPRINIHGPPGIAHMLASARRFIFRTGMPLSVHEYGVLDKQPALSEPSWTDENVQVWALPAALDSEISKGDEDSELESSSENDSGSSGTSPTELEKNQGIRQSIIKDMFDSDWRHDKLVEVDFQDVRLPAKIHVRNRNTKMLESFNCASMSDAPSLSPTTKVLVRQPWPGSTWQALPSQKELPHKAVSYIVRGHAQRGIFEKAKAIALGLKPGPSYSKLAAGEQVQAKDGSIITPDMVLGPAKPGRGIAIIDLPSSAFISDLLRRPEWSDPEIMGGIESFCWITSGNVLESPQIQEFMRSRPFVQHIFASRNACPNHLAMESSAASTIRLSRISREHFPVPIHDNLNGVPLCYDPPKTSLPTAVPNLPGRPAERGLTIQIEPSYQIQEQHVVPFLNTYKVIQETPSTALDLARDVVKNAVATSNVTNGALYDQDPEVITLGTGSAVPSKYRNVSATLLNMPGYGYYMFDCGENTFGQLKRMYDVTALNHILSNMRMLWISHLHADHHLGTLSLIHAVQYARRLQQPKPSAPFALIADEAMIDFVHDMGGGKSKLKQSHIHSLICRAGQPLRLKKLGGQVSELNSDFLSRALHIRTLETTWVSHCVGAQAISVEFMNGFKISYSGDCRPSKNFARIGRGSDVLIHEATFEDGLEGDARAKKHSTTSEALGVAAQMQAKNVILTHFSQRYQKIPVMTHIKPSEEIWFEEGAEEVDLPGPVEGETIPNTDGLSPEEISLRAAAESKKVEVHGAPLPRVDPTNVVEQMNVCIAFDFMRTRVSQIKDMHKLYPAIEALFESQQKVDLEATSDEKAEAINRGKTKSKKGEKRKSDSDGEGQKQRKGGNMSNKALKRQQQHQTEGVTRNEGQHNTAPPVKSKVLKDESKHTDLPFQVDSEALEQIMDITSRVETDKHV
jgi:ribonuclease Z